MVPSGLVTAAYLGRTLGPEFYGLFAVATAVSVTLEWAIISLFARATVKLLGEAEDWRPVASTILTVHLVAGLTRRRDVLGWRRLGRASARATPAWHPGWHCSHSKCPSPRPPPPAATS